MIFCPLLTHLWTEKGKANKNRMHKLLGRMECAQICFHWTKQNEYFCGNLSVCCVRTIAQSQTADDLPSYPHTLSVYISIVNKMKSNCANFWIILQQKKQIFESRAEWRKWQNCSFRTNTAAVCFEYRLCREVGILFSVGRYRFLRIIWNTIDCNGEHIQIV